MDSLGQRERAILLLYAEGSSLAQIAADSDLPYQTVYSVWRRAMAKLRERFGNDLGYCKKTSRKPLSLPGKDSPAAEHSN
jgi:DNA-directed RNA polymerase specialized sigma24 family protein